jgi:hypothetical protein
MDTNGVFGFFEGMRLAPLSSLRGGPGGTPASPAAGTNIMGLRHLNGGICTRGRRGRRPSNVVGLSCRSANMRRGISGGPAAPPAACTNGTDPYVSTRNISTRGRRGRRPSTGCASFSLSLINIKACDCCGWYQSDLRPVAISAGRYLIGGGNLAPYRF